MVTDLGTEDIQKSGRQSLAQNQKIEKSEGLIPVDLPKSHAHAPLRQFIENETDKSNTALPSNEMVDTPTRKQAISKSDASQKQNQDTESMSDDDEDCSNGHATEEQEQEMSDNSANRKALFRQKLTRSDGPNPVLSQLPDAARAYNNAFYDSLDTWNNHYPKSYQDSINS